MTTETHIVNSGLSKMPLGKLMSEAVFIAQEAGDIINDFRSKVLDPDFDITIKDDNSPVTQADMASSRFIVNELHRLTPSLAVVSEENTTEIPLNSPYWLIDPLDGTKIFLNGGTGFAVHIALIIEGSPALGVVECPALDTVYYSAQGLPSFKQMSDKTAEIIQTKKQPAIDKLQGAFDGAHGDHDIYQETQLFLSKTFNLDLPKAPTMERNAPLNMLVAEGIIDIHVKTGRDPTLRGSGGFSWDNAADHIILRNAGGGIVDLYNNSTGLKPYDRVGRGRMHGYMAMGSLHLRNQIFPQHH